MHPSRPVTVLGGHLIEHTFEGRVRPVERELPQHLVALRPECALDRACERGDQPVALLHDEDHPQVYWSVGKDWHPGSVLFKRDEVPELLRQLRRVPRGAGRRRVLDIVLDRLPGIEARRAERDHPRADLAGGAVPERRRGLERPCRPLDEVLHGKGGVVLELQR